MESSQAMRMVWKRSVDGDILILVSLVVVSGALIWATLTTGHDWGGDFAQYIMQARSVVEGNPADSLRQNQLAVEQSTRPMGPLAYPWGTPLLLAPLYGVFGLNMVGLKILNVVCYLTWILLIWLGWRRYHPRLLGFVLVMLFAFNPTLVYSTNSLLSDIPFTLFSTAGILLIGAVVAEKRTFLSPAADYALLGLLLAFCFFVRTNGLLLVFTLFLAQMITGLSAFKRGNGWVAPSEFVTRSILRLRRSDKGGGAGWILPYISFAVAVLIWNRFFPEGGASHLGHLGRLDLAWVTGNVVYYATVGAGFFRGFPLHLLLYSATIPLLIIGILGRFRNDYPMIIYGLLTLALYIIWPARQGIRFLFPILTIYAHFVLIGLTRAPDFFMLSQRAVARWCFIGIALAVVAALLGASAKQAAANLENQREHSDGPFSLAAQEMFTFVRGSTEEDSVILFRKPRVMRLFTDRQSVMVESVSALDLGDYLCLELAKGEDDQISSMSAERLMGEGRLDLIFGNLEYSVFRIIRDG